jgi:hypothetical protein
MQDKVEVDEYRKVVYEGDMAWARGLPIAEYLVRTIGRLSIYSMPVIADHILKASTNPPKLACRDGVEKIDASYCQKLVHDLYNGDRVCFNCPECAKGHNRMVLYKYGLTDKLALKLAADICTRPFLGAAKLARLEERYQAYDEANCLPPSNDIKDQVHPGWNNYNNSGKPCQYIDTPAVEYVLKYDKPKTVIYSHDNRHFNNYINSLRKMAKKVGTTFDKTYVTNFERRMELLTMDTDKHSDAKDQLQLLEKLGIRVTGRVHYKSLLKHVKKCTISLFE